MKKIMYATILGISSLYAGQEEIDCTSKQALICKYADYCYTQLYNECMQKRTQVEETWSANPKRKYKKLQRKLRAINTEWRRKRKLLKGCFGVEGLNINENPAYNIQLSTTNKFSDMFWHELAPYIHECYTLHEQLANQQLNMPKYIIGLLEKKYGNLRKELRKIIGDPNAKEYGNWGSPLLQKAFYQKEEIRGEVVWLLLECGADSNTDMDHGKPLFYARTVPMVQLLIKYGADIKQHSGWANNPWETLLANAMQTDYPVELVQFYLDNKLNVNEKDSNNFTALHQLGFQATNCYEDEDINAMEQKVQLLLSKGALVNETDSLHNRTPIDCAQQHRDIYGPKKSMDRFAELMRAAGGKTVQELGIQPPPPLPFDEVLYSIPWLYPL